MNDTMTDATVTSMINVVSENLADRTAWLVLADALTECGREAEGELIRASQWVKLEDGIVVPYRPTMAEFMSAYRITATATETDATPAELAKDAWMRDASHWKVSFKMAGSRKRLTTRFHMGSALTGEPTASDVLGSLVSDATGVMNAGGFEAWCDDYGYDSDSREIMRVYGECVKELGRLQRFFGAEVFAELLAVEPE